MQLTQQEKNELIALIAHKITTLYETYNLGTVDIAEDMIKAILKEYVIIKIENNEIISRQS
jgi:hypothetical protein